MEHLLPENEYTCKNWSTIYVQNIVYRKKTLLQDQIWWDAHEYFVCFFSFSSPRRHWLILHFGIGIINVWYDFFFRFCAELYKLFWNFQ